MVPSHVVLHAFSAGGRELQSGEHVDATDWRNTEKLVACKYLRPITPADMEIAARRASAKSTPVRKPVRQLKKLVIKRK